MPGEHVAAIDASLHEQYFKPFQPADELEAGHPDWCSLIAAHLPTFVSRARDLPAHELLLGEPFDWT